MKIPPTPRSAITAVAASRLSPRRRNPSRDQERQVLDDVMRLAYERYSGTRGYTDDEFAAVISEVAHRSYRLDSPHARHRRGV